MPAHVKAMICKLLHKTCTFTAYNANIKKCRKKRFPTKTPIPIGTKMLPCYTSSLQVLASITVFLLALLLSPLLVILYLLCCLHRCFIALVVRGRSMTFLCGQDAISGQDMATCNAIINVLTLIDGAIKHKDLKDLLLLRMVLAKDNKGRLLFPKFSRYVTSVGDFLVWHDEEHFNIDNHVVAYTEKPPSTEDELQKTVTQVCNTPMDTDKSGWQVIIIPLERDFFQTLPGRPRSAVTVPTTGVIWRFHHAVGDGISLARLIMEHIAENKTKLTQLISVHKSWASRIAFNIVKNVTAILSAPRVLVTPVYAGKENIIHGPKLTGHKLIEWGNPICLQLIKDIKSATSTTVNDVILSCLGGSLQRYFQCHDQVVPTSISIVIPVTMQNVNEPLNISNNFSFATVNVDTSTDDALQRLKVTKATMDSIKRSPDVFINHWFIQNIFSVLPNTLTKWLVTKSSFTLIASNVPGPQTPVKILGQTITQVIPFLPHRGRTGVAIGIFSYAGEIRLGISVDSALIKRREDIRLLIDGFSEELHNLSQLLKI